MPESEINTMCLNHIMLLDAMKRKRSHKTDKAIGKRKRREASAERALSIAKTEATKNRSHTDLQTL